MTRKGSPRSAETRAKIGARNLGNSTATREDDEKFLTILRLRDAGWSCAQIGRRVGLTPEAVRLRLNRVDAAIAADETPSDGKAA